MPQNTPNFSLALIVSSNKSFLILNVWVRSHRSWRASVWPTQLDKHVADRHPIPAFQARWFFCWDKNTMTPKQEHRWWKHLFALEFQSGSSLRDLSHYLHSQRRGETGACCLRAAAPASFLHHPQFREGPRKWYHPQQQVSSHLNCLSR